MKPSNYLLLFALFTSCKPDDNRDAHIDNNKDKGKQRGSYANDSQSTRTIGTNRPPVASGTTSESEEIFIEIASLEAAANSRRLDDPQAFLGKVKNIPYPAFDSASAPMKAKIIHICRSVGETQSLAVNERMEYIFNLLPLGATPGVVDDMIRGMDAQGLDELNTWLTKMPKGPEKNEIYYVIGQRLENLGFTPDEIRAWAKKASGPQEIQSILKAL